MLSVLSSRWFPPLFGALCIVAGFAVLQVLLHLDIVNRYIIPFPTDVVLAFERIIAEEEVLERCRETGFEMLMAGLITVVVGIPLGALLYRFDILRRAYEDWVAALAAAPIVLAFPLFLVLFGRSPKTIIIMAAIHGVAPIILKTLEGLSSTRKVLINVGRSLNMNERQMFWKILFPSALPTIFTGIRLGWTFCLISVVGIEFLINLGGLGQLINDLAERYDMPGTYAAISFVILVSMGFFIVLERIETWLQPER